MAKNSRPKKFFCSQGVEHRGVEKICLGIFTKRDGARFGV